MTIQLTRWTPDTCTSNPPCIIDYQWDDSVDPSIRVHSLKSIIQKCADHAALSGTSHYNAIKAENDNKNNTRNGIMDFLITNNLTNYIFLDPQDNTWKLKNGNDFNISWTGVAPNRVLHISLRAPDGSHVVIPAGTLTSLQTLVDTKVGVGKVVLS